MEIGARTIIYPNELLARRCIAHSILSDVAVADASTSSSHGDLASAPAWFAINRMIGAVPLLQADFILFQLRSPTQPRIT